MCFCVLGRHPRPLPFAPLPPSVLMYTQNPCAHISLICSKIAAASHPKALLSLIVRLTLSLVSCLQQERKNIKNNNINKYPWRTSRAVTTTLSLRSSPRRAIATTAAPAAAPTSSPSRGPLEPLQRRTPPTRIRTLRLPRHLPSPPPSSPPTPQFPTHSMQLLVARIATSNNHRMITHPLLLSTRLHRHPRLHRRHLSIRSMSSS